MNRSRVIRSAATLSMFAVTVAACGSDESSSLSTDVAVQETPSADSAPVSAPATTEPEVPSTNAESTVPATTVAPETPSTTAAPRVYDFTEVSAVVDAFVAEEGLNGAGLIIVEQDDGVVHEEYWGEFDAERVSLVASAAKSVSAGVLMRLDDEGLLDVDAPVADVVDWGSANPDITPAQLLSHSSGLPGVFENLGIEAYDCQFAASIRLQDCAADAFSTPEDDADVVAPDTQVRYGGISWQIAGAVAEVASGRSWAELIDETYVQPCGFEPGSFGYTNGFPPDFGGDSANLVMTDNPNIEAGLFTTPGAYAEWLLVNLRGGVCGDGQQVLSQRALDAMHADRIDEVFGGTFFVDKEYGLGQGWAIRRDNSRLLDPGIFGTVPWLDLAGGYGAYLVIEDTSATGQALAFSIWDLVDAAVLAAR